MKGIFRPKSKTRPRFSRDFSSEESVLWRRKMTDIKRLSLALLAPLMIVSVSPVQAEETVIKRTTVIETSGKTSPNGATSISVTASKSYSLKFKERLNNLNQQNDTALSKGWINADEHTKFKAEIDRLSGVEAKVEAAGFPKADVDDLEKQVTKVNADLSTASNKPKTNTATTSTTTKTTTAPATKTTATAKKTAAGDTKKTTTTTKTTAAKK